MSERWDEISVDGSAMRCFVALPEGGSTHPGVIVCMHAYGLDGFIREICRRLATHGIAALAPDVYHRQGDAIENPMERMGLIRDDSALRDLNAATALLRGLPEVDAARCGVIGFCMGGRLAWLHATDDAELRAAVTLHGGNIMVPWGDHPTPFERSDRIACAVLGLFGADDPNPSPADEAKLDAELKRLGVVHEFVSYAGAGHAFLNERGANYHEEAAKDAWARCCDWLDKYL